MGDDVGSEVERTAVDRRSEGVVYDQRYALTVSNVGHLADVEDVEGGVGDGFAEKEFGVGTESLENVLGRGVLIDEGDFNTHFLERDGEKVVGAPIDGGCTDDMVAGFADVEDGVE